MDCPRAAECTKCFHVLAQIRFPAALPRRETLELVHEPEFLRAFCDGALSPGAVKRIGFGEVVRSPVLVERTLAEVAGAGRPKPTTSRQPPTRSDSQAGYFPASSSGCFCPRMSSVSIRSQKSMHA